MRQYDWGQISMRGVEDGESGEPWHADVEETRVARFVDGIWCGISNSLAMQAWRCLLASSWHSADVSDMLVNFVRTFCIVPKSRHHEIQRSDCFTSCGFDECSGRCKYHGAAERSNRKSYSCRREL